MKLDEDALTRKLENKSPRNLVQRECQRTIRSSGACDAGPAGGQSARRRRECRLEVCRCRLAGPPAAPPMQHTAARVARGCEGIPGILLSAACFGCSRFGQEILETGHHLPQKTHAGFTNPTKQVLTFLVLCLPVIRCQQAKRRGAGRTGTGVICSTGFAPSHPASQLHASQLYGCCKTGRSSDAP